MLFSLETTTLLLRGASLVAIGTGSIDVLFGVRAAGRVAEMQKVSYLPLVDSQLRFFGAIWAGYGASLWYVTNDLSNRQQLLGILGASLFVGGIGRVMSGLKYGIKPAWVQAATASELLAPPLVYLMTREYSTSS